MGLATGLRSIRCLVAPIFPSRPFHISLNLESFLTIFPGSSLSSSLMWTSPVHDRVTFYESVLSSALSTTPGLGRLYVKISLIYYGYCNPLPP